METWSYWKQLNMSPFYSETGAVDRSQDIMMQIDQARLRDCNSLYMENLVR